MGIAVGYLLFLQEQIKDHHHLEEVEQSAAFYFWVLINLFAVSVLSHSTKGIERWFTARNFRKSMRPVCFLCKFALEPLFESIMESAWRVGVRPPCVVSSSGKK
jgi:hypothetical protein